MSESVLGRLTLGRSGLAQAERGFSLYARIGYFSDFRVDAIRYGERSWYFRMDSMVQVPRAGTPWTIDAEKNLRITGSFTAAAVLQKEQSYSGDAWMDYTHASVEMANPTWTHVPQANAKAIVVVLSAYNDYASAVTYGNKALTARYQPNHYGRYTEVWTLSDLSGRADDVIRVTGMAANCFASSTVLSGHAAITYATVNAVSSWTGWVAGNYITTLNDTLSQPTIKALFSIAGGEGGDPHAAANPYGTGYWLSSGDTNASNSVATVLTIQGPDTSSITGGFAVFTASCSRYHWSMLMQESAFLPGKTVDAIRHQHWDKTFSAGSWFRHENYAVFSTTADAAQLETLGGSFSLDAHFPDHIHVDAVILAPLRSGIVSSGAVVSANYLTDVSWAHPMVSGDSALVVALFGSSGNQAISVTYGGLPLTYVIHEYYSGELWVLTDLTQRRADDIIRVDNAKTVRGASVMLRSQNPVSIARSVFHASANHNGQYLSNTLERYPAGYSSAVAVHLETGYYGSTPASGSSPGAGTTTEGFLLRSTAAPSYWGSLGTTPSVGVGPVTGGFNILTSDSRGMLTVLLQSAPNDGASFNVAASLLKEGTGSRAVDAWFRWVIPGTFALDASITGFRADAVIAGESVGSFALESRVRLGEYFESFFEAAAEISLIHETFSVDAYVSSTGPVYDLSDSRLTAPGILAPDIGESISVRGSFEDFTADATDPPVYGLRTGPSGWMRLDVLQASLFFIESFDSYYDDPDLAIWGPQEAPPTTSQDPWHYSDGPGSDQAQYYYRPGFSDTSTDAPLGTLYVGGSSNANYGSGLTLESGSYWIAVWPYGGGAETGYIAINIENRGPIFRLDALIAPSEGFSTFTDEAVDAVAVTSPAPGQTLFAFGDFSLLTYNVNDPYPLYYSSPGNATGWLKLEVPKRARFRIDTSGSRYIVPYSTYLPETELTLWDSLPNADSEPIHYAGSNYASNDEEDYLSSLIDSASGYAYGTRYPMGSSSAQPPGAGVTLAAGTYWIAVRAEYYLDGVWLNIENLDSPTFFDVDALIVLPPTFTYDYVQSATVLGSLPNRQNAVYYLGNYGAAGYAGGSVTVTSPATSTNDLLVAFISGDEEGSQREIWSPGWTQYAYFPTDDHSHAGWIFTRRRGQYDPATYTFYWDAGFKSSMAVSVAAYRYNASATPKPYDASLGMYRTHVETRTIPTFSYLPHYTSPLVVYPGQEVLTAFFFNAFASGGSVLAYPAGFSYLSQAGTNYAQLRAIRTSGYTEPTLVRQYYATYGNGTSMDMSVQLAIIPTPVYGWPVDAFIFRGILVNAVKGRSYAKTFTVNAIRDDKHVSGDFTVDAYYEHGGVIPLSAIVIGPVLSTKPINAVKLQHDYGVGSFGVQYQWAIARRFILKSAVGRETISSGTVDAVISGRPIRVDARIHVPSNPYAFFYSDSIRKRNMTSSFRVDAAIRSRTRTGAFTVYAITMVPVSQGTITGSFSAGAWVYALWGTVVFSGEDGWPIDAVVDSYWSETTFTIDAETTLPDRYGSFTAGADIAASGDTRGAFAASSLLGSAGTGLFYANAYVTQGYFRLFADIAGVFRLDALLGVLSGSGSFVASAVKRTSVTTSVTANAVLADAAGDYRAIHVDASLTSSQRGAFALLGALVRGASGSFSLDARLGGAITLDAFIRTGFYVNAYIAFGELVVWPPSQEGTGGTVTGGVFTDPTADFDDSLVGSIIVIAGEEYVIVAVIDGQTLVIEEVGGGTPPDVAPSPWSVPSGSATDAYGGEPPVTRSNHVRILWARPFTDDWHDITGDTLWSATRFTQSARVGAGTFELHLEGAYPSFIGGEEIRVEVDGLVVFGGYTTDVERGYVFSDLSTPKTVLHGTDYNIVLDKLVVYNAEWDEDHGGVGHYENWTPFAKGVSDRYIIRTIARDYLSRMPGFNFHTYVDEIESPAPTKRWTMQPGTTLRDVLTEISRITEGMWWIDPYRNLHYHDRNSVTAPFPITDGDGGISCRELSVSSDISIVSNDVFAWGTEAYQPEGGGIIYSHQEADATWSVLYWEDKIENVQERIDAIRAIPYDERTTKQRADLSALKRAKAVYQQKLASAEARGGQGSVQRFGRWQYAEFRQDIYKQNALDRRATAIMRRYGEPVVKASAVIFDHGFQAGQVAFVSSLTHAYADEMPIREMTLEFATIKEPDDRYRAVPRYRLMLGLDPEEPWNVYQFLPFNYEYSRPGIHVNPPAGWEISPSTTDSTSILDDFTRDYESDTDFGISTSDRVETRVWEEEA